jgi:methionine-rich copper-binding protein CopC
VPNRLTTGVLALMAALLLPGLAKAHAILEDSSPKAGASVQAGALDLRFRYNSRIDRGRSRLTLIRADRSRDIVAIAPDGPPNTIGAHLDLTPGSYVVRWQVPAVDGHITRGDVRFVVTAP